MPASSCSTCPRAPAWPTRSTGSTSLADGLPLVMAVNREYAPRDQVLDAGDELALIPPVSGGEAGAAPHVRVTGEPLALDPLVARVRDPRAGAVVTFQGVTREVDSLEYEAYAEMAARAHRGDRARGDRDPRPLRRRRRAPRGRGPAVASRAWRWPPRLPTAAEAFAGAREIIDRVKAEAPIWKLEVEGGERRWVEGTEPPSG